ncbi:protein YceG like [Cutibacterium acnes JCM 18909]|nr:protein YceG like [Cutibacterium acnes JCM 18909]
MTPIKSDYLYWVVTDPDKGTTAYSKTLAEHKKKMSRNSKLGVRTQGEVLGQYVLI